MTVRQSPICFQPALSDRDVMDAMKAIEGYIDITPSDFREIYRLAFRHAIDRVLHTASARQIMTPDPHVIPMDMNLMEAAGILARARISGAPVVDPVFRVTGVVSEKDFLTAFGLDPSASFMQIIRHCLLSQECFQPSTGKDTVSAIISRPAITAGPDASLSLLSGLMSENRINRIPIVDYGGKAIGIVTRGDLTHAIAALKP
ncbi:CBS domain-containing protein [Desulfobotulus sp. H1]|uniref:CBS domain-containing protein n=1 Tax=Desulfobotulus pelophilus TaxID=2823377 RepID=A0ABT3N6X1_9BACT|nr:CBS domain-containing protein [Desulfobotulus pelophilus]MCW7752911.1 CBS domain-containing protein [Desulfobotulus pelophilus]